MASKVSAGIDGTEPTQSNVQSSGSYTTGSVVIGFNDDASSAVVMDLLERAKAQIQTYYAKKG